MGLSTALDHSDLHRLHKELSEELNCFKISMNESSYIGPLVFAHPETMLIQCRDAKENHKLKKQKPFGNHTAKGKKSALI